MEGGCVGYVNDDYDRETERIEPMSKRHVIYPMKSTFSYMCLNCDQPVYKVVAPSYYKVKTFWRHYPALATYPR